MKKSFILVLALLVAGGGAYWWKQSRKVAPVKSVVVPEILYYTCVMHSFIHRDEPGKCPICSMDLIPVKKGQPAAPEGSLESAGEDPLRGLAPVNLTPFKEQMIGVKLAKAAPGSVVRIIRTVGRFAGGAGNFASAAGSFAAREGGPISSFRYVVADVYALDQPFLRLGQKAWVSTLNGGHEKVEGRVARIYPYDETQSRVVRVKIDLKKPEGGEIFANVEIQASVEARITVPREAIMHTGSQNYVYIQKSRGRFDPQTVALGFQGDDLCEVTSALQMGDEVAWGGNFMTAADAHINGNPETNK